MRNVVVDKAIFPSFLFTSKRKDSFRRRGLSPCSSKIQPKCRIVAGFMARFANLLRERSPCKRTHYALRYGSLTTDG